MKKKSQDMTKTQEWPHFIINSMADGVITVDGEMHITDLNRAAEKLTGFSRQEAMGRFCGEVLQSSLCGRECPLRTAMASGEVISQEATLKSHGEEKVDVMLTASALRDDMGNLLGGVETFRDIGPIKQMERERRQLAGMFAHDLKGPVVAVAGLLNRLIEGKVGELSERQTSYLETIYQEVQRLEKLISNFLDFVRLDLHILTPLPSALQVEKECQEVINRCQPLAGAKDIALELEFPQNIVVLQADPILFQRVLCNLIENAIKYSPPRSHVILTVSDLGREVQFAVKDQGSGIAPEDQPHLFELLFRGKTAGKEIGLGLGLAIVKRIIDAHNGRIWVESEVGNGAEFFFTMPKQHESD
jgi:two-component system, OmpR family, phosphate regulon sensor histidine kinase PhoR